MIVSKRINCTDTQKAETHTLTVLAFCIGETLCKTSQKGCTSQKRGRNAARLTLQVLVDCVNGVLPVEFIPQVK